MDETHFGFEQVAAADKARRVRGVFDSVAGKYDLMNDLLSAGMHRLWKRFAVNASGVRAGMRVLDLAGGTGDLARLFADRVGASGVVVLTDINPAMLAVGRDRLLDAGHCIPAVQCDAERLPFVSAHFDCVSIAFGLRNVTHKETALAEMRRVLRPGGQLFICEPASTFLRRALTILLTSPVGGVSRFSRDKRAMVEAEWETLEPWLEAEPGLPDRVVAGGFRVEFFRRCCLHHYGRFCAV